MAVGTFLFADYCQSINKMRILEDTWPTFIARINEGQKDFFTIWYVGKEFLLNIEKY